MVSRWIAPHGIALTAARTACRGRARHDKDPLALRASDVAQPRWAKLSDRFQVARGQHPALTIAMVRRSNRTWML